MGISEVYIKACLLFRWIYVFSLLSMDELSIHQTVTCYLYTDRLGFKA